MFSTLIIDELNEGGSRFSDGIVVSANWIELDVTLIILLISSICTLYIYIFINVNNDENTKAIWWILEGLISLRAFIDCRPGNNGDTVIAYKQILLHKGVGGNPDMRKYNSTTLHPYTCWSILIHLPVYDLFPLQH